MVQNLRDFLVFRKGNRLGPIGASAFEDRLAQSYTAYTPSGNGTLTVALEKL